MENSTKRAGTELVSEIRVEVIEAEDTRVRRVGDAISGVPAAVHYAAAVMAPSQTHRSDHEPTEGASGRMWSSYLVAAVAFLCHSIALRAVLNPPGVVSTVLRCRLVWNADSGLFLPFDLLPRPRGAGGVHVTIQAYRPFAMQFITVKKKRR